MSTGSLTIQTPVFLDPDRDMVPFSLSLAMIFFTIGRDMPVTCAICGWVIEGSSRMHLMMIAESSLSVA